jgi:Domain of unknown function (DUF4340)
MRSPALTLVLLLLAALACVPAVWQWRQGNFDRLFGVPHTAVGAHLYDSFKPADVQHILVASGSVSARFSLKPNGWQATSPWADRMDPRAALGIINFTLGMRVEDVAAVDETDDSQSGLGDSAVVIRLEDAERRTLARYMLGRMTPWKAEVEGFDQPVPTVFVRTRDKHRRRHVYVCTGDINPLFKDGLRFLRDHRPFYFNPAGVGKIRIRSQQGDLTLGRETADSPWRVVKPLDLPTDPVAIKALLEGLFDLQAIRVSDRAATAPAADDTAKTMQIALTPLGGKNETVLEIHPPESPEAREAGASVSERPGTWFELPVKPEPGLVSLADLPLSMNELRDPTLTRLNIASLRAISIQPSTGTPILLSRESPRPWMAVIDGVSREANEENLYALLKTVTTGRATGFESDAATDFTPWGLDRPVLVLRFLGSDNQALELRFGLDIRGNLFVNRLGAPTVMRVDPALLSTIAVRPYEWRHARLWSLDRYRLKSIERRSQDGPPLVLRYHFMDESWQASSEGRNLDADLDPQRANYMLSVLEGLKVARWLAVGDEQAASALASPSLVFNVVEKSTADEADSGVVSQRTLTLAPVRSGAFAGYYCGRIDSEPHPFLIDAGTHDKLAADLLDR